MKRTLALCIFLPACGALSNGGNETSATASAGTDSAGTDSTGNGETVETTIYEIQQGNVPENTRVQLRNVVVTTPVQQTEGAVLVQEQDGGEWSGIYVFMYTEVVAGANLQPGDVVDIAGEYTEFFGTSELTVTAVSDVAVTGTATPPTPPVVAPADVATMGSLAENYESVPVRVENLTVTNPDLGFNEFEVNGVLRVDDFFMEGMPAVPNGGDMMSAIVAPLIFSFDEFKLAPRGLEDLEGWNMAEPTAATIYEIQQGMVAENTAVTITDVVATSGLSADGDGFFVQDPMGGTHSGIYVFLPDPTGFTVAEGDQVTLTGTYTEFNGVSELTLSAPDKLVTTGTAAVPAPVVVSAAEVATMGAMAEDYEGVLIAVENVTVTNPDLGFGEFELDMSLRVDDMFFAMGTWMTPVMDQGYMSITGPLHFSFDDFKIEPRSAADLVAN